LPQPGRVPEVVLDADLPHHGTLPAPTGEHAEPLQFQVVPCTGAQVVAIVLRLLGSLVALYIVLETS